MSYLVDTNVLSELRRRKPDADVVRWLEGRPATTLYLSVLTLGELRKGIEMLPASLRGAVPALARYRSAMPVPASRYQR